MTELKQFATEIARHIGGGEVFFLEGDLGAGKTTFTSYFAVALGAKQDVSSPTFTIEQVYEIAHGLRIRHFDLYRITSAPELFVAEFLEGLYDKNEVRLVEWGESLLPYLPKYTLIRFNRSAKGENIRELTIEEIG